MQNDLSIPKAAPELDGPGHQITLRLLGSNAKRAIAELGVAAEELKGALSASHALPNGSRSKNLYKTSNTIQQSLQLVQGETGAAENAGLAAFAARFIET